MRVAEDVSEIEFVPVPECELDHENVREVDELADTENVADWYSVKV
jgi:hypothetical protein